MKTLFTSFLLAGFAFLAPASVFAGTGTSTESLRKEIETIVRHRPVQEKLSGVQEVKVDFLINAQREMVVFAVTGDNLSLCDHVKSQLNFRKVSFRNAKQLHPYSVTIRFINGSGTPIALLRA